MLLLSLCKQFCCQAIRRSFPLALRNSSSMTNIANHRLKYLSEKNVLLENNLPSTNPIILFDHWFKVACRSAEIVEPNAMTLATVKGDGRPSARMVLLKGYNEDGFKFYTNYQSNKAQDISVNAYAALVFYWVKLFRSVRIEGAVEKMSAEESDEYFSTRPRPSQIAAHVSQHQSSPIECREILKSRESKLMELYKDKPVPRPEFWGGYIVKPDRIEFWQGQQTRIHDRIEFVKNASLNDELFNKGKNGWLYRRLEP